MEDCCKMGLAKFEQLITESCGSSCIEAKEMHELVNSLRKLRGLTNQLNRSDKETFIKLLFQYFEIVLSYITTTVTEYSMKIQRSSELLSNAVAPFLKDNELNDIIFDSMLKNLFELVLLKGDYATPCTLAIFKLIISIADQSLEHPRVQKAAANNTYNLLRLADTLGLHGDYVLQLTVIEAIIKFSNSVNKENGYLFFPGNPILNDALLAINLDNFDVYVRRFLNEFNERSPYIFSFPYFSIQIGNTDINSISQDGNSWIDFNMKEDNLSFYVYNESKTLWNRIIIICDDISKVEIKRASLSVTLRMHQTKPCISLRSEEQHYWEDLERMVEININNEDSGKFNKLINTILPQLFGNKFMHTSNRIAKSSRNDKVYRPIEESKKIFRKTRNSLSADEKYKQKCTSKSPSQFSSANTSWVESSKCPGDNTDNTFSGSESETVVSSSNNLATSLSSAGQTNQESSLGSVDSNLSISNIPKISNSIQILAGHSGNSQGKELNDIIQFQPSELLSSSPIRKSANMCFTETEEFFSCNSENINSTEKVSTRNRIVVSLSNEFETANDYFEEEIDDKQEDDDELLDEEVFNILNNAKEVDKNLNNYQSGSEVFNQFDEGLRPIKVSNNMEICDSGEMSLNDIDSDGNISNIFAVSNSLSEILTENEVTLTHKDITSNFNNENENGNLNFPEPSSSNNKEETRPDRAESQEKPKKVSFISSSKFENVTISNTSSTSNNSEETVVNNKVEFQDMQLTIALAPLSVCEISKFTGQLDSRINNEDTSLNIVNSQEQEIELNEPSVVNALQQNDDTTILNEENTNNVILEPETHEEVYHSFESEPTVSQNLLCTEYQTASQDIFEQKTQSFDESKLNHLPESQNNAEVFNCSLIDIVRSDIDDTNDSFPQLSLKVNVGIPDTKPNSPAVVISEILQENENNVECVLIDLTNDDDDDDEYHINILDRVPKRNQSKLSLKRSKLNTASEVVKSKSLKEESKIFSKIIASNKLIKQTPRKPRQRRVLKENTLLNTNLIEIPIKDRLDNKIKSAKSSNKENVEVRRSTRNLKLNVEKDHLKAQAAKFPIILSQENRKKLDPILPVSDGIEHSPSNVSTDDSIIFPIQSRISGSEKSENQDESRRNNKVFSEDSSSSKSDASSHILRGSVSEGVLVRHRSDTSDDEVILEDKMPSSNEDACDQEINKATSDQVILPPRNDSSSHIPEMTENVPLDVTDLPERAIINEEILTAEELEPLYLERSFCSPVSERIEAERPSELITEKNLISPTSANDFSDQVLKNTKNVADERPITIVKEVIPQQELLPSSKKDSCIHVAEKSVVDDRQPEINSEKNASEIVVLPASSEKDSSGSASKIINLQNVSKRKKLYNPNDFSHLEAATSSLEESVEHHESVFLAPKKRTERKKSTKKRTRTESRTKLVRKPKNLNNFPLCIGRANPADIFKAYDSCVPHLVNRDLARLNAIDSAVRYESDEEKGQSANDEFNHLSSISRSVLSALPENDVVTENNDTYIRILDNIKLPSRKRIFNKKDTIEDVQSPNKRSRTDHSSNFDENDRFNFLRGGLRNQDQCARCKTNELGLNILLDVVNHMKQNKSTSLELIDSVLKQLK